MITNRKIIIGFASNTFIHRYKINATAANHNISTAAGPYNIATIIITG